ncbi:hypothetical protein CAPTEDRAFT_178888 [Capitella teleta]|uniref:SCP domain-containing protein n=1 Tax=Capitella teleta TaxID=283909 RepID=R7U314_CAPTE|nr:hypothetical protein CAPTEDRAFT_178888 [Capitella teleta]|eukprot:ELT97570.1 hypothetical protein CAPTEDRAFT_178888 [Capitella teleta]
MADKRFLDTCLKRHNEYRKRHQVPQMKLNTCMSAVAQKWAEHLAKTNTFAHSKDREVDGKKMGENIAMKYTSSGDDFTGEQVTDQWYSEVQKYNFNGTGGGGGTGHFTQVVWKESVELGVGKAQTQDGKWLVVANYLPAGNFMGKYKENVFPAKDGKIDLLTQEGGGAKPAEKGKKEKGSKKKSSCTIL